MKRDRMIDYLARYPTADYLYFLHRRNPLTIMTHSKGFEQTYNTFYLTDTEN